MKKLTALLFCLFAFPALALDGAAILKKVDRNLEPESYEMMRKLINKRQSFALPVVGTRKVPLNCTVVMMVENKSFS